MQNRTMRPRRRQYGAAKNRSNRNNTKSIHPSKFINKAIAPEVEVPYAPTHTFHDFNLNPRVVSTLDYIGFKEPSKIQDQAIPFAVEGKDVIGLANTGTGKTAAFLLPIITKIADDNQRGNVLILAPTRELAGQIDVEFRRFAAGQKLYSALVIGGTNIGRQIREIERGPHVIIGTPGRVKDLINRRVLRLSNVETFVLDEADRMCDMGFEKDIRFIANELPVGRQTLCFSATMTPGVQSIVSSFMHEPVTVSVTQSTTNDHIDQDVVYVDGRDHKVDKLIELLKQNDFEKVIVFGETKYGVQRLSDRLAKEGIHSVAIHGNKSQSQREKALRQFKDKKTPINVLVATDVAARGLDVPDITHVINFDPPKVYDDYIHRIGRTGRAGRTGIALTFIEQRSPAAHR